MDRRCHRVRDVAEQAELSPATVDRVLHGRPGTSPRAVRAVERALLDLDRQVTQVRLARCSLIIDVVLDAPSRFRAAVRDAAEETLATLRPATVRARFHESDGLVPADLAQVIDGVGASGWVSNGVILKAPDDEQVAAAVSRAFARSLPTVTLVTDVSGCERVAYVGLDNAAAGATAAYLMSHLLRNRPGAILASVSHRAFLGEQERFAAFEEGLARSDPERPIVPLPDVRGDDLASEQAAAEVLRRRTDVVGVYSMGGGNTGIARALESTGRKGMPFVGHDLDADNLPLLRSGALTAVIHHDLRADLRAGFTQLLRTNRVVPGAPTSVSSLPQVVTPWNVPARLEGRARHH